jgi:uncharacterized protein YbjT (DUF2867 family)
MTITKKNVLVLGGTGLIGKELTYLLLESDWVAQVHVLLRRPLQIKHHKLVQHNFDDQSVQDIRVDAFFCCIGTTINDAGSQEAFRNVDYNLAVNWAQFAMKKGATELHLVSAVGADAKSAIFYNKVKGETENAYSNMGATRVFIYQPSLLLGQRKQFRFGEWIAQKISKPLSIVMIGPLKAFKPIEGKKVAINMVLNAQQQKAGIHIVSNAAMHEA